MKNQPSLLIILLLLTIPLIGFLKEDTVKGFITGTVKQKFPQENMILVKEHKTENTGNYEHKIPVDNIEEYEIGDKVEITVYMHPDKNGTTTYENSEFVIKKLN